MFQPIRDQSFDDASSERPGDLFWNTKICCICIVLSLLNLEKPYTMVVLLKTNCMFQDNVEQMLLTSVWITQVSNHTPPPYPVDRWALVDQVSCTLCVRWSFQPDRIVPLWGPLFNWFSGTSHEGTIQSIQVSTKFNCSTFPWLDSCRNGTTHTSHGTRIFMVVSRSFMSALTTSGCQILCCTTSK